MTTIGNRPISGGLLGMHAITSVHWGSGTNLGAVDLPIHRERHTDWPNGPGSAIKGVLRDACRESIGGNRKDADQSEMVRQLFGSAKTSSEESNAGALSVTDARLLAFPVRSLKGVFAWISCPSVLSRLARDASLMGITVPELKLTPSEKKAFVAKGCPLIVSDKYLQFDDDTLEVDAVEDSSNVGQWIADRLLPSHQAYESTCLRFVKQFVVVSDNTFTYFTKHATEIVARIGLNYETKTVKDGALFYQELLPPESLLYSVLLINDSRTAASAKCDSMMTAFRKLVEKTRLLQMGGDETTGKGYCAIHLAV